MLTEDEELELLELENEEALLKQRDANQASPVPMPAFMPPPGQGVGAFDIAPSMSTVTAGGGGVPSSYQPTRMDRAVSSMADAAVPTLGVMGGAQAGAALGAPFGPVGAAVGGALGAGVGAAAGTFGVRTARGDTPAQAGQAALRSGAVNAAVPLGISALGAGVRYAAPVLGSMTRATSAVPEKYATAAFRDPGLLSRAPTVAQAGQQYGAAVRGAGITSDNLMADVAGKRILGTSDWTALMNNALDKLDDGTASLEELLAGRQAATKLSNMAKMGMPEQAQNAAEYARAKASLDAVLGEAIEGYNPARQAYFNANVRDQFSSFLPRNANQSPNVLRSMTGAGLVGTGLAQAVSSEQTARSALGLITLGMGTSPAVWGAGIRTGYRAGQAAPYLTPAMMEAYDRARGRRP